MTDTSIDIETPIPLSAWVRGTLTIHFEGAVVKHPVSMEEAHRFDQMVNDRRSSDAVDWSAVKWFTFDSTKVLFSSFEPDEDYGWPLTPEERDRLAKSGHPHGILRSLLNHWASRDHEPAYSPLVMHHLFKAAHEGTSSEVFYRLADKLEGEAGTRLFDRVLDDYIEKAASKERGERQETAPKAASEASAAKDRSDDADKGGTFGGDITPDEPSAPSEGGDSASHQPSGPEDGDGRDEE